MEAYLGGHSQKPQLIHLLLPVSQDYNFLDPVAIRENPKSYITSNFVRFLQGFRNQEQPQ